VIFPHRLNGYVKSGSPSAGVLVNSLFISWKAFSWSGPQFGGYFPEPAVAHKVVWPGSNTQVSRYDRILLLPRILGFPFWSLSVE
jgi:hypothetical protein